MLIRRGRNQAGGPIHTSQASTYGDRDAGQSLHRRRRSETFKRRLDYGEYVSSVMIIAGAESRHLIAAGIAAPRTDLSVIGRLNRMSLPAVMPGAKCSGAVTERAEMVTVDAQMARWVSTIVTDHVLSRRR